MELIYLTLVVPLFLILFSRKKLIFCFFPSYKHISCFSLLEAYHRSKGGIPMKDTAIFAGGCFWCMVKPFDSQPGILKVVSGFTGGHVPNPTYQQVTTGTTGHTEAVEITFDPEVISYEELVAIYWQQTDPTDAFGQFADRGDSYRPVIFYNSEEQKAIAEKSKAQLQASGRFDRPIVTKIEPAEPFYPAEDYHQDFYKKNAAHYNAYSEGSGRAGFIRQNWA
jgi:peptide-methionine (S)-S-oxide reductase